MVVKNGVETYRYYVTSSLGTTSLVLGEDGAILEESDTNPYGDIRYGTNDPNTTTYYGLHERNDTTGLVDMEARMYDPTNLQFSAPDPMSLYSPNSFLSDPQQMHMYAYGRNNPVRYNDPTGMASKSVKNTLSSAKSTATKAVSTVTSSSAFKSVMGRFGGSGSTQTIAPGVMQGPMQLVGPKIPPNVILPYEGSNFSGVKVKANSSFIDELKEINSTAIKNNVTIKVTHAGLREVGKKLDGAIVTPSSKSNHFVASAIDMNVVSADGTICNSTCLGSSKMPTDVASFINDISSSKNLRWGGEWKGGNFDPVHIDNGFNINDPVGWKEAYRQLQGVPFNE